MSALYRTLLLLLAVSPSVTVPLLPLSHFHRRDSGLGCVPASRTPRIPFVAPIIEAAKMINGTLAALACLILGMQIKVESFERLLPIVAISAALQMGLQPLLAYAQAVLYHLGGLERQFLVLIAAMSSAVLGPYSRFATNAMVNWLRP